MALGSLVYCFVVVSALEILVEDLLYLVCQRLEGAASIKIANL